MKRSLLLSLSLILAACGPSSSNTGDSGTGQRDARTSDASFFWPDGWVPGDAGPGTDAIQGCDPKNFTLQQAEPAEVYLVIDRSGSMNEPGTVPPASKWDETITAVEYVLTQFDGAIKFGVLIYPADSECSTSGPQVGTSLNNLGAIMYHLGAAIPAGGTPTKAALTNASSSLIDLGHIDSPKFLILATDGGPNCNYFLDADPSCTCSYATADYCCTNYPAPCYFGQMCLDETSTLDTITDLHNNHTIDTFVIGLAGTSEYENLLNAMAVAGGRPQQGGTTDYYAANNQTELQNALSAIAVSVISCVIELEEPPDLPDLVRIYMDGAEVPRDPVNGWEYTDGTHMAIELHGVACDTLQDGTEHTITATFACVVD